VENAYVVVLADRCLGQEIRELPDLLLVETVCLSFLPVLLGLPERDRDPYPSVVIRQ
jgi:hypothetical protein